MPKLNSTFRALLKEAEFTKEMLGSGATKIRLADYSSKGIYFQSFTSLSTGLERIGKLCLMLDHYIDHDGAFPDFEYLKKNIGHNLILLYEKSQELIQRRSISFRFNSDLQNPIHQSILKVLSDFAEGDRYSNINLLVGSKNQSDPIASWFKHVDGPIFELKVSPKKRALIKHNAAIIASLMGAHSYVLHTSEDGEEITDLEEASVRSGRQEAVAPHRQLYVLQIIRYWIQLLDQLERPARALGKLEVPDFLELFASFYNDDRFFKGRKTWDRL